MAETIYALASAHGRAGVAVVRISGDTADAVANTVTENVVGTFAPRVLSMVHITHPHDNSSIDHAMAVRFVPPHSFTGEAVVELHCHGSRAVLQALFCALDTAGARLAYPGEFSKRAFANGKMDLTEAEGLIDLINAETAMQLQHAQSQSRGVMRHTYTRWVDTILPLLAHYEAYIDFPDEDIPDTVAQDAFAKIDALVSDMEYHLQSAGVSERIRNGIQVAVIGRPNAGKSSLVNILTKRDVAIVSPTAGTTRDVIEVSLDIGGYPVRMFDTAGLRHTCDHVESQGIKRATQTANTADILVLVMDGTQTIVNDMSITEHLADIQNPHAPVVVLANKSEKIGFNTPKMRKNVFCVSIVKNDGIDAFMAYLQGVISERFSTVSDPIITRHRHRVALGDCVAYLKRAKSAPVVELTAEDLRLAVRALGRITGQVDVEDILDIVFQDFCIGK